MKLRRIRYWLENVRDTFIAMREAAKITFHRCENGHHWESTMGRICPLCGKERRH